MVNYKKILSIAGLIIGGSILVGGCILSSNPIILTGLLVFIGSGVSFAAFSLTSKRYH